MIPQVLFLIYVLSNGSQVIAADGRRDGAIFDEEMERMASETFPRNIAVETLVAAGLKPVKGDATQLNHSARSCRQKGERCRRQAASELTPIVPSPPCHAHR